MVPWLLPPLLSKNECWAAQYKPGDTSFCTRQSATRSRLGWFPSTAVWCCFGRRRPGRWVTLGTWKKRVSSASLGLCQGHDYSHSLGSAQETFPVGPGWNSIRLDGKSCISWPKHKWTDGPCQIFLLLYAHSAKQASGQSPLKPSSCAMCLFCVHSLYCSRDCTMIGHPRRAEGCVFEPLTHFKLQVRKQKSWQGLGQFGGILSCSCHASCPFAHLNLVAYHCKPLWNSVLFPSRNNFWKPAPFMENTGSRIEETKALWV